MRDFDGGIAEWKEAGLPVERGPARIAPRGLAATARARRSAGDAAVDWVASRSISGLVATWLGMNVAFGVVYWLACFASGQGLLEQGAQVGHGARGLGEAIYFSFVTGLSIGFGDIVPVGAVRLLAIVHGSLGLLLFGCVISKLVSRRQEEVTDEIHRIAFEDRLGRVRTNLHLVVSEMQEIAAACRDREDGREAALTRVESAAAVFAGEMRAIHDLLYRPQTTPAEDVLESILAHLDGGLREFTTLLECLGPGRRSSPALAANVRAMSALASEICGNCVPREFAPHLKTWMDRVQALGRRLEVPVA